MKRIKINHVIVNRIARWLSVCAIFVATAALGERIIAPPTVDFPDFPFGVAVIDLGQTLTIHVATTHDSGKGVTWSCVGDGCTKLTSTSQWATFYAGGITGTATITATSIKNPRIHQTLRVTVYLNAVPNMLCDSLPAQISREAAA